MGGCTHVVYGRTRMTMGVGHPAHRMQQVKLPVRTGFPACQVAAGGGVVGAGPWYSYVPDPTGGGGQSERVSGIRDYLRGTLQSHLPSSVSPGTGGVGVTDHRTFV